jgi:hypothetical protein
MTYCKIFVDTLAGLNYSPAIPQFSDGVRVLSWLKIIPVYGRARTTLR